MKLSRANKIDGVQLLAGRPVFVGSVQASTGRRITLTAARHTVVVDLTRRTITGTVYRFGEVGVTSAGPMRVDAAMPAPPVGLPVTREHDRPCPDGCDVQHEHAVIRGHVAMVDLDDERLRVAVRVVDGPVGDLALAEAADRTRAAFSFDIEDAEVVDDAIVWARWAYLGQVRDPAFNSARIDSIAAARAAGINGEDNAMTDEQRARLRDLIAQQNLSEEERAELDTLTNLALAEATAEDTPPAEGDTPPAEGEGTSTSVAASRPLVPGGVPAPRRAATRTGTPRSALDAFVSTVVSALRPGGGGAAAITAAFTDVTQTGVGGDVSAPAWSGELWSGVEYQPEFSPLLASGPLTNFEGKGWRWVIKPTMADYAGDKAAVPSAAVSVEPGTWEAARLATGNDFDRKFYDFPNEDFLRSYVAAVGESTKMQIDEKAHAYILANATASGLTSPTVLGAAAKAVRAVKRARMGRASFVILSDADFDSLMDITNNSVPAFLDLFDIDPKNFTSSDTLAPNSVIAGVKQAATLRTLGGDSPIRVSAQHLANGGIDEAFFTYWAIEEHSSLAIQKTTVVPAP